MGWEGWLKFGGEGGSQYTLQPQTDVSGALGPPPGAESRLGFKSEEHGVWCPDRAKGFLEGGVRGYMELVVWSLGFPRASGAWVLQQSEDKWVDTWIPKRRMGLWMLGSMEGIVRGCHF